MKNKITEIRGTTGDWNGIKAYVNVTFDTGLVVKGIKIREGKNGLFAAMPSVMRKDKETGQNKWEDCCFFPDKEKREEFQAILMDWYEKSGGQSSKNGSKKSIIQKAEKTFDLDELPF